MKFLQIHNKGSRWGSVFLKSPPAPISSCHLFLSKLHPLQSMRLTDAALNLNQELLTPTKGGQGTNDTSRVGLIWWRNDYVTILLFIPQSIFPVTFHWLLNLTHTSQTHTRNISPVLALQTVEIESNLNSPIGINNMNKEVCK